MSDFENMTGPEYANLYARFLRRSPDELLLADGSVEGKRVLDLCAGGLRASVRAKELGASYVCAIDVSRKMMSEMSESDQNAPDLQVIGDLSRPGVFRHFVDWNFDLAICQQGVNYWWNEGSIQALAGALTENGAFVFNSFISKPGPLSIRREYTFEGVKYAEEMWSVGNTVVHIQECDGKRHQSDFRWIPMHKFEADLQGHFKDVWMEIMPNKKTMIFVAKKG